jgi:hypothetical protein
MSDEMQYPQGPAQIETLIAAHRELIRSIAQEDDSLSLAQPSPLRYVPNITTDRTTALREDRETVA